MDTAELGDLVSLAREGHREAWDELVARHIGVVHAVCRSQGLTDGAAAAVNEVVWLRLVENLATIRRADAVGGWIAATARNECLRQARRPVDGAAPGGDTWLDTGVVVYERDRTLLAAFRRLDDDGRDVLRLQLADPVPPDRDVAAALDMPEAEVRTIRRRALGQLRRCGESA